MKLASFLLLLCALVACGPAPNDPGPGGVTVSEAEALDEAAAMLDERRERREAATRQNEPPR